MKWTWPGRIAVVFGLIIVTALLIGIWTRDEVKYNPFNWYRPYPWWDFTSNIAITSVIGLLVCLVWELTLDDFRRRR